MLSMNALLLSEANKVCVVLLAGLKRSAEDVAWANEFDLVRVGGARARRFPLQCSCAERHAPGMHERVPDSEARNRTDFK